MRDAPGQRGFERVFRSRLERAVALVALGTPASDAATSLAPEHIRFVGNILLLASPLVLLAPLSLAHRVYVLNNGHVVHEGPAAELKARPELLQRYLSV